MSNHHQQFITPSTPGQGQTVQGHSSSPVLPVTIEQAKQMADYFGQLAVLSQQISSVYHQIYHQARSQPLLTPGNGASAQSYLYPASLNHRSMDQSQVMNQPAYLLPALLPPMPSFGSISTSDQPAAPSQAGTPNAGTSKDLGSPVEVSKPSKKAKKSHDPSSSSPAVKRRIKPNGFNQFSAQMRATVKQAYPDLTTNEISKKLGTMWKDLPPESREKYKEEAIKVRDAQEAAAASANGIQNGSGSSSIVPSSSPSPATNGMNGATAAGPATDGSLPMSIAMHLGNETRHPQHTLVHGSRDDLQPSNAWF